MKSKRIACGFEVAYQSDVALAILEREVMDDGLYRQDGIKINDGDVIFDVGANIGFFLLYLNRRVTDARVFCFEPIPQNFELLKRNAEINNRLDARLFNLGLSDAVDAATFRYYPRMSVNSSMFIDDGPEARRVARQFVYEELRNRSVILRALFKTTPQIVWWPICEAIRRWGNKHQEVRCELRPLSDIIDEQMIGDIDLLKIDVEGAEESVMRGIRDDHWRRVRQVMIETHRGREQAERVQAELRRLGFEVHARPCFARIDNLYMVVGARRAAQLPDVLVEVDDAKIGAR